jgi:hypothetical protein
MGNATQRHHQQNYPGRDYTSFVQQTRDDVLLAWDPTSWSDLPCHRLRDKLGLPVSVK